MSRSFWILFGILGCTPVPEEGPALDVLQQHLITAPPPIDPTNAFVDDVNAAAFGTLLFFDTRLSTSGDVSCATCHRPEHGFAEEATLSNGLGTTTRHTPSVLNIAWNRWFFWDGHADSAWAQALKPLESTNEHDFNRLAIVHLLHSDASLNEAYRNTFGTLPDVSDAARFPDHARPMQETEHPEHIAWQQMESQDQHQVNTVFANVGKALAAYQQTLIQINAPFDQYVAARAANNPNAADLLSKEATLGMELSLIHI